MSDFTNLVDLASERLNGRVIAANDEFFAPKENLLKTSKPSFIEDKYTDRGKWMDGWETRRRRTPGHDWCVVQLGAPGILRGVVVDTSFFRGNYPESCSIECCAVDGALNAEKLLSPDLQWTEVLAQSPLKGDSQNLFALEKAPAERFTHLRLHIYPDGGVARLRVFGEAVPDWRRILGKTETVDLVALQHGAQIIDCSDKFFSAPQNLLMPDKSAHMGDGWETKRRRGPGYDWVIISLGIAGSIEKIEVDTSHFKGNFPESCSLESCDVGDGDLSKATWKEVLTRSKLEADKVRTFKIDDGHQATHVRFNIFPDGGVARLRIYGRPSAAGKSVAALRWMNALSGHAASETLMACCGSKKWTQQVVAGRPFSTTQQLMQQANQSFDHLSDQDWLEAFSHHPKIGEQKAVGGQLAQQWAKGEQSDTANASAETLASLEKANQEYYSRFGYIFIVCATGKSANEMLRLLQQRLKNDPKTELRAASEEQRKITLLRLDKLLSI